MIKYIDHVRRYAVALAVLAVAALAPTLAAAQAQEWQVYFDHPQSPIMERIVSFNNGLMVVITLITLLVLGLLAWVIIRFRASRNPVPSKTTHNTVVEVLWTILPVLVLVGIAIPSFSLLFAQYDPSRVIDNYDPEQVLNVKVTGWTWDWQYEYPDYNFAGYFSNPITTTDTAETTIFGGTPDRVFAGEPRLLETDYPLVVPVGTVVRLQVTSPAVGGVIHSFAMPSMGVKLDAVPGRLSEVMVPCRERGHFLRPVLRALRQVSLRDADRVARRQPGSVRSVGCHDGERHARRRQGVVGPVGSGTPRQRRCSTLNVA